MNTRMAVITGVILVATSFFVTTLISQNVDQTTSTRSFAQAGDACEATNFDLGNASWNQRGGCYRYWSYRGPGVSASCPDGRSFHPAQDSVLRKWLADNHGGTCFTAEKWKEIADQWCCTDPEATNTPTPDPEDPEPEATNTPTPAPGECDPQGYYPDKGSCEEVNCCNSLVCSSAAPAPGVVCGPEPTPVPCVTGFQEGETCAEVNCCGGEECTTVGNPPAWGGAYCKPPATPTPVPNLNSCYNEKCQFNDEGEATCRNGRTCIVVSDPDQDPTQEFCNTSNDCRCVVNEQCANIEGREPGPYVPPGQPGHGDEEACWCIDCEDEGLGDWCEFDDPDACPEHAYCQSICFPDPVPGDPGRVTCLERGFCNTRFCPKPEGEGLLILIEKKIQELPGLDIVIENNPEVSLDRVLNGELDHLVGQDTQKKEEGGFLRFFNIFK